MKILFQGRASLRIVTKENTVVYVDPYMGDGYDIPADIILVTHQHGDHNQTDKPEKKSGCLIYQNFDALKNGKYMTLNFKDLVIEAVPSYNRNHNKEECVGYLITAEGKKLYIAGDTSKIPEMNELASRNIDYAFLPTDGYFNMGPEEAAECARIISAKHCIPIHTSPDKIYSRSNAEKFNAENRILMDLNEEIEI
ncbi:L-ascorbate metabolism protein UlaG (beta-lactamase superfamily) [Ruminiclostridium sufflavum DSM 19573]|uniref:L-ascorbate metabolism protein UlaG (Beta-lactamase superfamily) n=1 Tax=Ruminiclostridium sufflavum DSM 19573 TaxID=1121337 RepID=A0A318XKX8_9FIRM|nr:MBL fold metallo-hydrolase [Ruminiclostridium sufflavum]PYG87033.1 L-ascorbate metabolism protein UlaG (beta-lactamase superfamily) [Ruminiclostridium sufflavum DSM 19573]